MHPLRRLWLFRPPIGAGPKPFGRGEDAYPRGRRHPRCTEAGRSGRVCPGDSDGAPAFQDQGDRHAVRDVHLVRRFCLGHEIGHFGLQLGRQLARMVIGQRAVPAGIGVDLGPVEPDRAQLQHEVGRKSSRRSAWSSLIDGRPQYQ